MSANFWGTGNLTGEPELRFTNGGKAVTTFTIAINYKANKDAQEEAPLFIKVTVWEELAENVSRLTKGTRVFVAGRLKIEEWQTKEGDKRTTLALVADAVGPEMRFNPVTVHPREQRRDERRDEHDSRSRPSNNRGGSRGPSRPQRDFYDFDEEPF